jgi:hypothetical protein
MRSGLVFVASHWVKCLRRGGEPRLKLVPALQQADALPNELSLGPEISSVVYKVHRGKALNVLFQLWLLLIPICNRIRNSTHMISDVIQIRIFNSPLRL